MNKIEKKFINDGKALLQPRDWVILAKPDAIAFINECEIESISILAIDSFYIRGDAVEPSMEHSIDFTSNSYKAIENQYKTSLDFIFDKPDELVFEVVCEN